MSTSSGCSPRLRQRDGAGSAKDGKRMSRHVVSMKATEHTMHFVHLVPSLLSSVSGRVNVQ